MKHLVVDVQVVMIGSGLSEPEDDGSCHEFLQAIRRVADARLVWDSEGLIQAQYESKLKPGTFGHEWLTGVLLARKTVVVERAKLEKGTKRRILDTGLVGEDLRYYVRTAASSPDRRLVSHDSDYDAATCRVLSKHVDVRVLDAQRGSAFLSGLAE